SFGDAVVAQRTLVHGLRFRLQIPASIRASLHAVTASQAISLVHQHDAVRADECGAYGTDLHARRIHALIAELGNEEALEVGASERRESIDSALGRFHARRLAFLD